MNNSQITEWLERQFDTSYPPTNMTELTQELMPLFAHIWQEGFKEGEAYGALWKKGDEPPPNPYGKPTNWTAP